MYVHHQAIPLYSVLIIIYVIPVKADRSLSQRLSSFFCRPTSLSLTQPPGKTGYPLPTA